MVDMVHVTERDLDRCGEGRAFQSEGTEVSLIKTFERWSCRFLRIKFKALTLAKEGSGRNQMQKLL